MDNFEKNIRDNKAFFDDKKADKAKMWEHINSELDKKPSRVIKFSKLSYLKIAASLLLFFGLSATVGVAIFNNANSASQNTIVSKELMEINMHYGNLVSHQVKLVKNHPKLPNSDKEEFLSFMDELDLEYLELKIEMDKNLDNEIVLEAIIQNYKKRIELIENLLSRISESKIEKDNYGYTL